MGFPGGSDSKESAWNAGDTGLMPGSGRYPGGGNDNPLWYSCLKNSMDKGACGLQFMGLQRVRHNWVTNTTTLQIFCSWNKDVLFSDEVNEWSCHSKDVFVFLVWKRLQLLCFLSLSLGCKSNVFGSTDEPLDCLETFMKPYYENKHHDRESNGG